MTSRKLYLAKILENIKRRNWTFLLCAVLTFLFQPVTAAINLTSAWNDLQEDLEAGIEVTYIEMWRQNQQNFFMRTCGLSEEMFVLVVGFAILFAVQGFSYLYSRKKMDFYMSVPVSAPKRYMMIMGNSVAIFGMIYLFNLVLCMCICAGFGLFTGKMFLQLLLSWLIMMLTFVAIYQMALTAVMLTGNVLTALLGCCAFILYEPVVRLMADQLKSTYFVTYCGMESQRFLNQPYVTPVANASAFLNNTGYQNCVLYGAPYGDDISVYAGVVIQILVLLIFIAVWGGMAYLLYRKRKTESYGTAVAFKPAKVLIRFMLLIPFSVAVGMIASLWAGGSQIFLWSGALTGLLLGHAVIQLIYERDLRAVGKRVFSCVFSGAAAAFILAVFCFDLRGYDYYVPDSEDVVSVSVTVENDYSGLGRRYRVPFDGARLDIQNTLINEMNSEDPDTIEAVLSMAGAYVEHLKEDGDTYGRKHDESNDYHCWIVRYKLKNGQKIFRKFYSDAMQQAENVNTILRDEAYQNIRCQIFDIEFAQELDKMKIVYSNGVMDYLYTMDKALLHEALVKEMRGYDYDLVSGSLPVGLISFAIPSPEKVNSNLCYWEFPVYESFEETLTLLADNGIPVWEKHALKAEDIAAVNIHYYHYENESDNELQLFEETVVIEERAITVTISDQKEIEKLLDALYPQQLVEITDSSVHRYQEFASGIDVEVNLSESGRHKRLNVPYMNVLKEKLPEFVMEKLREAVLAE